MADEDIDALIRAGLALEKEGNEQQAIDYFKDLAARFPDNPMVAFETGGVYDSAGHEAEAVLYYKQALELGLPDKYFPRIAVQLGSSLRNVGQYEEAIRIL